MPSKPVRFRIAVGADHGGFGLKESIKSELTRRGHAVYDCGTHSTDAVDYPKFAHAVARRVSTGQADFGIMVDRAGIGSAMAANKLPGVRATLCYDLTSARNSREHNNANVLTLGSGLIGPDLALQIVELWLSTACTVERHLRRAAMIEPTSDNDGDGHRTRSSNEPADGGQSAAEVDLAETMDNLSDADIERIVQRIAELSGSPGAAHCTNLACAFCQACAETNPEFVRQLVGLGADRVGHRPGAGAVPNELAAYIDHTLLKPDASRQEIVDLCAEAAQYHFASVCVNPTYVRLAAEQLKASRVPVCSVVGFPFGAHVPEIKALEARRALRDGAGEIDMVINVGALKSGDDELVYRDIRAVTDACHEARAICKVIIETAMLTDEEKIRACQAARKARADFVKTSTGYGGGGATAHDVALMAEAVHGTKMGVKASGGIRSFEDAQQMIQAGATRLGVSAGVKIVKQAKAVTVSGGGSA
ncbi:MAG: deoxyribose-phosphate aldolase [Planctomycetes bacterium]|nr:deoxyribose-phosphate aldolase [Planctomycetota bacterium]